MSRDRSSGESGAEAEDAAREERCDPSDVAEEPRKEVAADMASEETFEKLVGEEAEKARSPARQWSGTSLLLPP